MIDTHHTPGPWAERDGRIFAAGREELDIATIASSADSDYSKANARVLAAAPELLEALQRLSDQCTRLRMAWQLESDAERNARVVIAKAIGVAE